jgi:hypothetical protein
MTESNPNLEALVQFLTDASETSGDHFMRAADMLRIQQARIAELERLIERMGHKAELYDEACALVGTLGHMNVTNAVSALQARIAELEAKAADGTDWKAIAIVLGQRVNWAISHISERGTGLVLNTNTGESRHWKVYLAEALRMIPGVTINDDILAAHCLPAGEKRKRFKQLAKRDEQAGTGVES